MVLMRQIESRVLDRLDDVTHQLDRLSDRLDRFDGGGGEATEDEDGVTIGKRKGEEHPPQ
jgi:hypothetical protein